MPNTIPNRSHEEVSPVWLILPDHKPLREVRANMEQEPQRNECYWLVCWLMFSKPFFPTKGHWSKEQCCPQEAGPSCVD